jgi:tRNA(fMet)-specific endonuclease VapC
MIEYVLDTNAVSELMRERPNAAFEDALTRRWSSCAVPAPAVDELQFGISRFADRERQRLYQQWLDSLIADVPIIPLDAYCAQWHGRERARLMAAGKPPSLYDGLIASIAVVNELVLVTHNTADFESFSEIRLQDWHRR